MNGGSILAKGSGSSVTIVGTLGRDPELFYSSSGTAIASCSLAHTEGFGNNQKTVWTTCKFFGKQAEAVKEYLSKGSKVFVTGTLDEETWTDKSGTKKYKTVISCNTFESLSSGQAKQEQQTSSPIDNLPI